MPDDANIGVALRIKVAMVMRKTSMRRLAAGTGIPYRSVQNYLTGNTRIPAVVVARFADHLNISSDILLGGKAPVFDLEIVEECLRLLEDVRQLSKSTTLAQASALFERFYRSGLHDRWAPLEYRVKEGRLAPEEEDSQGGQPAQLKGAQ